MKVLSVDGNGPSKPKPDGKGGKGTTKKKKRS